MHGWRRRWSGRLSAGLVGTVGAVCLGTAPLLAQEHPGEYSRADIEYGLQLYAANCEACHGVNGDGVAGVNFRSGFRNASSDRILRLVIQEGLPGTGMPPGAYDDAELSGLVAYLRMMGSFDRTSVTPGDPARGRALFVGKGGCTTCHRVQGQGPLSGPDLSRIGAVRSPGTLERAILDPSGSMFPMNRPIRAVTRDGQVVTGRRLNEDTHTIQLLTDDERLVSLDKSELSELERLTRSPMPPYREEFNEAERADMLAYLLSLKGSLPE